ncbi:: hypothetical protein [Arcticibacter svalbardensis MN12-7]|uniref:Heparinase II/III-like protein n=1 Tax=Arcticibacter svalbardensis MN12-7 TaxID=1150600 RepID=R9GTU8_9SPHI|nr:heparinase II/III family protein [Arcticibacter svalbardensis]EOR95272.1 : hypothetical protein [Arcticibacter svalbardensis MN12-7]
MLKPVLLIISYLFLNEKNIKRYFIILSIGFGLMISLNSHAQIINIPQSIPSAHPRMLTTSNGQTELKEKLKSAPWAQKLVDKLKSKLDPYVLKVEQDSSYMFSRLQMYWNSHHTDVTIKGTSFIKAEGEAPVPTVRFSGSRDWSTPYKAPKIDDLIPFADPKDGKVYMMKDGKGVWIQPSESGLAIEKINQSILEFAQDAAFLYWLTGEERYAKFAEDIFVTYITGLYYRNLPKALDDNEISGLTSFEVIHQGDIISTALCYDFLYPYLQKKHPNYDKQFVVPVFKKWANNLLDHGVVDNNWNIFEARFLTYLALGLEDNKNYKDGKGASFYLDAIFNQTNRRQAPLTESLQNFDAKTHIWNESPGYSVNVSKDFLKIALIANHVMPNCLDNMVAALADAVDATTQYLYPSKIPVSFGDGAYKHLPTESLQYLISWYRAKGNTALEQKYTQLFTFFEESNVQKPDEGDLFELFFYVDKLLPAKTTKLQDYATPTFYAPNVSWFVQRNGFDPLHGMMISTTGSLGNHSHANGISMELYGKGYPLAPDMGKGDSYWQANHREFYAQFAAHNTVIVDGQSSYGSMRGKYPFKLNSFYPAIAQKDNFFKNITYSNVSFTEPETESNQNRLLSTIRTGNSTGYYLDIFRAKKENGKDIKNEYLYHNLGQEVQVFGEDKKPLTFAKTEELSTKSGDIKGYDYFTEKTKAIYSTSFTARFDLKLPKKREINMNMWMLGNEGREIFKVLSPKAHSVAAILPKDVADAAVPTLVIRQKGEAWTKPFVAIYEPAENKESNIESVNEFKPGTPNLNFVGVQVVNKNQAAQFIFSDALAQQNNIYKNYAFKGSYAVASTKEKQLEYLFLAKGKLFFNKEFGLEAKEDTTTATLAHENGEWSIYAAQATNLFILKDKCNGALKAKNKNGDVQTIKGALIKRQKQEFWMFAIPSLNNDFLLFGLD